ncbi:1-phosphofructokinase family hexose kinase [Deinobacterium chartae]|uniref:1-phosphofructokinase family hexose kinase n=1 Tax=Deinobacterium chartae TaxID=521158 RepID=A0A841I0S5_9DEIO|nr:1-phosphofructokinase family hexose kinase [Deinobacterium chartae]MBB6098030.1 1-phosphofructokinase family hexose kinase [Deinobacterium chartae]
MIHTLTLNPTLDLTFVAREFRDDDTTRAHTVYREPGGKGINVSRVATRLGHPNVALGLMGGPTGLEVLQALEQEGVVTWFVTLTPEEGITRTNPIVQDDTGRQVRVSSPGPQGSARAARALLARLGALADPDFLVVGGSSLPGLPADFQTQVVRAARARGVRVMLDADGPDLLRGIRAGATLIKPNHHELVRLVGRELPGKDAVLEAAHEVLSLGVQTVVVSLGGEGALLVQADGVWQAVPPPVRVGSAVGAGDSLVAGLCARLAEGDGPQEALAFGVACGTATATTSGTQLCHLEDVRQVLQRVRSQRLA